MSGLKHNLKIRKEKKPLSHGWIVVPSKSYPDRVYFYNTVSKCSTWNNPCKDDDNNESDDDSSATLHLERERLLKNKNKSSKTSQSKKQKSKIILHSLERNCNVRINHEIEDYDEEQDQYFDNIPSNAFNSSGSNVFGSSNSPNSPSSSKTSVSDSDQQSDSNVLIEDNKKELWLHFVLSPKKLSAKKSVALSDLDEPSTIRNLELEMTQETEKKMSSLKNLSKNTKQSYLKNGSFNESACQHANSFKSRKMKRKKKEKFSEAVSGKTVKNVLFKKHNKTPAQTRLLKLIKQNAEKIKELAAKNPDFAITEKKGIESNTNVRRSADSFDLEKKTENDSFSDACFKQTELCNNVAQADGNYSKTDYSEEMDWEPSSEESDVRNINVFRQQLERTSKVSIDNFFGINEDHTSGLPSKTQSWFLVLDTNIFVSCLGFVKELRDTNIPELGYPIIYVPWRVLQELDHLKDTKIDAVDKQLLFHVRKAIAYLNENFKSKHPRVFGQSFEDFTSVVDIEVSAPDDEILQTCIQFQKKHTNKLILLTNDKNLESKAIISGVEVYSKERFQKKYLNSSCISPKFNNTISTSSDRRVRIDDCLCEVKTILKDFMSLVVETEMKIAFDRDWIKLAYKKPPWSLQDALDCLLKHWRSVFFVNFSKEVHSEAEYLYDQLFKKTAVSSEDVIEIIRTTQRLILLIKRSQKKKRPYTDLISARVTEISKLLEALSANQTQSDGAVASSLPSSVSAINNSLFHSPKGFQDEVSSSDISKMKNLFKDIWDCLRSFCCLVSDVIHSSGAKNDLTLQEIKLKLSQTLNDIKELVVAVENILEINPTDISDFHPVVLYFSSLLIRVHPTMAIDTKSELPKSLAAFLTDFEGRFLLSSSLEDFREFFRDLSKATEYFNTHTSNPHFFC